MSAPNNICRVLIVYGSYAPGGDNHELVSHLPGEWKKGKILANMIHPPDDIGPGEDHEIEAWTIQFSDCQAELFTAEWEAQERLLYERWTALDTAMGETWARDQRRWWPEGKEPVVAANGMIVVNIYLPLKNVPYLANRDDVPAPDEAHDIRRLWQQQKSGEKSYEEYEFIALIKDARVHELDSLFGDLTNAKPFIRKLKTFFQDHELHDGSVLLTPNQTGCYLYVCPLERNALPREKLLQLARDKIALLQGILRTEKKDKEAQAAADTLAGLTFEWGSAPGKNAEIDWDEPANGAMEIFGDLCLSLGPINEPWDTAIGEACYGIAASYELRSWFLSSWNDDQPDLGAVYEFWKAGGDFRFEDGKCIVYEVERRKDA